MIVLFLVKWFSQRFVVVGETTMLKLIKILYDKPLNRNGRHIDNDRSHYLLGELVIEPMSDYGKIDRSSRCSEGQSRSSNKKDFQSATN